MKKVSSIVILLALVIGLAFAGNPDIRTSQSGTRFSESLNCMQLDVIGSQIVSPNNWVFYLDNIAGFDAVDFYVTSVLSGNITTASLQPTYSDGTVLGTSFDAVLTSGTDLTNLKSMYYKMTIYNQKIGVTNNITCNILVTK
jgi:hypothetical protein